MSTWQLSTAAELALDTIRQRPRQSIPCWMLHIMNHEHLERLAGAAPGAYRRCPDEVYLAALINAGVCMLDQFIPDNPLTMGLTGYDEELGVPPPALDYLPYNPIDLTGSDVEGATTGGRILLNGMWVDSPEAVAAHLEGFVFPRIEQDIASFDEDRRVAEILAEERATQQRLGPEILKAGFNCVLFPYMYYGLYGYENYFMAYALYPEVMERHFRLQADYALLNNRAAARAYREGSLPPFQRLDFDMADSRGTLVNIKSLDRIWLPHFARCLEPMLHTDVRLVWHCDGNLMPMIPRLLEAGIGGFQGFQYEHGMDYRKICAMKTREGAGLLILAGLSVTTTLPFGTPADVRREMAFLVENGPRTGLFLGASSTITPETPWENVAALVEGIHYYRSHGRG
jgi:hypothetical protein